MAFNFPSGATNGQLYTADNGVVYIFDGTKWNTQSALDNYAITGSNTFVGNQSINGLVEITGSIIATSITGSIAATNGVISSSAQISASGFVSGSYETTGRGIISSSANLVTTSSFNSYTASIVTSISNLNSATSSYLTSLNGAISSSSQLTSSYDTRYVISGSVGATPLGTISGSAQITAFGFISSSQTIDTSSFATTGSNTFIGTETISGSLLLSGSFSYNGTPLQNGFAFAQPIVSKIVSNASYTGAASWTGTYVSNGGAIIVTANMSGFRSSGGSGTAQLLRDGVAVASQTFFFNIANYHTPITPLVYVSNSETGSHTYAVSYSDILVDTQDYATITVLEYGNSAILPATLISGSSQLTSSFDTRYTLSGSVQPLPAGTISGSSQLTSSFDTRYAISASFVSSPNVTSIQTITSASYAALTPVSGTLYIIIG